MEITLYGPSNPWWLSTAVGCGLAAFILTWRVWWMLTRVVFIGYYIAWQKIGRL